LSVVTSSVGFVEGDRDQGKPAPGEQPEATVTPEPEGVPEPVPESEPEASPESGPESAPGSPSPEEEPPGFVAAAFAQLDAAVEVLLGMGVTALPPEQVRAVARGIVRRQATVSAAALRVLAEIDGRDDVVPQARSGQASVAFQQHALGLDPFVARRESATAHLLAADRGDLAVMGAAYASGRVHRGHVDVAVRTCRELGARIRDELIPLDRDDPDLADLARHLAPDTEGDIWVRRIAVVDTKLTAWSTRLPVPTVDALARALVRELNPKAPPGGHEQRFLYMSQDLNGNWLGRFSCGQTQGALLRAAIAAGARPRPGLAIDEGGVQRELPDTRDLGQRNMDALADLVAIAADRAGVRLRADAGARPDPEPWPDRFGDLSAGANDDLSGEPERERSEACAEPSDDAGGEPEHEPREACPKSSDDVPGEPGHERSEACAEPSHGPSDASDNQGINGSRAGSRTRESDEVSGGGDVASGDPPVPEGEYVVVREPGVLSGPYPPVRILVSVYVDHLAAALACAAGARAPSPPWPEGAGESLPAGMSPPGCPDHPNDPGRPPSLGEVVARMGGQPWIQHAGHPTDTTLADLTARARLHRALRTPTGAVLSLGRSVRLASPAQRFALIARDVGCAIPGCGVPGEHCEVHHVIPWAAGGRTDLGNITFLCSRHHTETGQGTWEIEMRDGVPWVRLPSWVDRTRPFLRNHTHRLPPPSVPRQREEAAP
jgi:hypothetical protein